MMEGDGASGGSPRANEGHQGFWEVAGDQGKSSVGAETGDRSRAAGGREAVWGID